MCLNKELVEYFHNLQIDLLIYFLFLQKYKLMEAHKLLIEIFLVVFQRDNKCIQKVQEETW